jgi:hypothetical protein
LEEKFVRIEIERKSMGGAKEKKDPWRKKIKEGTAAGPTPLPYILRG